MGIKIIKPKILYIGNLITENRKPIYRSGRRTVFRSYEKYPVISTTVRTEVFGLEHGREHALPSYNKQIINHLHVFIYVFPFIFRAERIEL